MRLLRLELQDVGPFGHKVIDFPGSVIGVVGGNGIGKSTILNAVHYAVTGDLSRLGRRDAICVDRTSEAQPFVRLTFVPVPDAEPATITRWLPDGNRAGRRKLVHGERTTTADADVAANMAGWTGLSAKTLSDFVFVAQGELTAVVDDQPARRAEIMSRLFGTAPAEAARAACAAHLDRLPAPPDPIALTTLRASAAEAERLARDAEAVVAALPKATDPGALAAARAVVAANTAAADARVKRSHWDAQKAWAGARLAKPEVHAPDPGEVEAARQLHAAWRRYNDALRARYAAETNLAAARAAHAKAVAAVTEDPGPQPAKTHRHVALDARRVLRDVLADAGPGAPCPVCTTPLADTPPVEETADELEALAAAHAAATDRWRRAVTAAERARLTADFHATVADQAARALDALPPTPPRPQVEAATVEEFLATAEREAAAAAVDAVDRKNTAAALASAEEALASLPAVAAPDPEALSAAHALIAADRDATTDRRVRQAEAQALRQSADLAVAAAAKAEAAIARADRLVSWRETVAAARDALHRDAAPAAAVLKCLTDLAADLNYRLTHLAAAFRIELTAAGELTAVFRPEHPRKIPADRLSGGEKAVLAVAWRLAVLDRYAPRAGLLCLDEPTHGLDGRRIEALSSALAAWRPHGGDRQFVVVTHDRRLLPAFDAVIDL